MVTSKVLTLLINLVVEDGETCARRKRRVAEAAGRSDPPRSKDQLGLFINKAIVRCDFRSQNSGELVSWRGYFINAAWPEFTKTRPIYAATRFCKPILANDG